MSKTRFKAVKADNSAGIEVRRIINEQELQRLISELDTEKAALVAEAVGVVRRIIDMVRRI